MEEVLDRETASPFKVGFIEFIVQNKEEVFEREIASGFQGHCAHGVEGGESATPSP